MKKNDWKIT